MFDYGEVGSFRKWVGVVMYVGKEGYLWFSCVFGLAESRIDFDRIEVGRDEFNIIEFCRIDFNRGWLK